MKQRNKIIVWALSLLAAVAVVVGGISIARGAAGDVPAHDKVLNQNDDGTYTIALNVTGDSEKQIQKVNVIVIVDRSGSMDTQSGTGSYVPSNQNGTNMYGLIDGSYVPLTRQGGYGNYTYWYNGTQYTGQRYQYDSTATRMQATQAAVNSLAETLLEYNGKDGNPSDTVQMALVSFATTAQTNVNPTTSYSTFSTAVNGLNANGGTNWEASLRQANGVSFGDSDPTFVIFFSDGSPTFHSTDGGYNNWNNQYNVYGSGQEQEPNMERSYTQAVDDATTLANKVGAKNFYTIFAYGTNVGAGYMTSLTTAAGAPAENNYSASNTAELNDAFAEILESIEMAGIGAVDITDGTTSSVTTTTGEISHLLTVDESSYKYYRAGGTENGAEKYDSTANGGLGEEWTDAPEATFTDGAVEWDLAEEGVLENDVTYTVTFDCWPSQTTLDIVADIKNDPSSYDSLDANIKKYIDEDGNLKTNTTATMSYTDTRTGRSGSSEYENPDPVQTTAVEQLAVSKEWENELDGQTAAPITLNVTRDGTTHHTMKLSADNDWTSSTYISIGILRHADNGEYTDSEGKKFEVLETGHDFTFTEPADLGYYWEIQVPTVRPMLVDGTLTMLILKDSVYTNPDGAKEYNIDGKTYYVGSTGDASLTATNQRRSTLNLTKVVDGPDADPNQAFQFTLNVVDSKASEGSADDLSSDYYVWFSVWNDGYVDANVSGAEKEMKDGAWTGYYYAPSGTSITANLKAGDNLRFINLPTGSTYTLTEGTLPANYAFTSAELTAGNDTTFSGNQTSTGTIQETNTNYTVTYTNTYNLADIEITKVWEDNGDQDGIRPTAEEFKSHLVLKADGTDVTANNASKLTVTDNGDDTYTAKWTGLDRYANGEEITYTVEETEIEGYTTTGSPAEDKGTITNTHTPEVLDVTVVKVWEDSDDIGKIRPASINAQLTADGTASGDPVALNADNKWTYTWTELPKYKDGKEIVYSADETVVPAGYDKTGPEKSTAEDGTVTFTVTNTYNPTPVSVDPPVQKVITGNDSLYNKGDFTFTIEAVTEGAPMPANTSITNSADNELEGKTGFYEFGEITFTKPGTYTYKVTESGDVDGVTNDPAAETGKELTFTVTDDGNGKLVVSPTTDQVQLSFTNVYNADGEASIVVSKEITGAAWPAGKTLTLTIAGASGAPMPETTTASLTAAGSVTFGPIAYGLADAGKTYTYTITEDSFGAGWSGDPASITATVEVTDNGDGTLGTTVTYSPEDAKFINTYKATGKATLEVEKKLEGAAWPEGKTLTMTLTGTESAPMPADGGDTVTLSAAGKATFGEITYTEADAGKTYTYTITEGSFGKGWTGTPASITATVEVTDNGDGTLATKVTYDPADKTFTNTYEATGTAVLEATKAIKGAAWPEDATITFTLAGEGGTLPETKTVELTEPGKAAFGAITYTEADAGKTYTYTITEDGFGKGWTGSPEEITATVKVTDNGDGTLKTEVTYSPENATFTNTYKAEGEAELDITKAIVGAAWPEGKTLKFTVAPSDGAPAPEKTEVELSAAGKASFGTIAFDESDAGKTYTYTITEDGFGKGWTGTPASITATVEVTDNGDGTLATKVTYDPADKTFTNTYEATGTAVLEATKAIKGAAWPEDATITFTLAGEGGTLPETKTVELTEPGKAAFGAITYTEADAGKTYTYTITEDGFGKGWTGTPTSITATVTVTDNGDGTLATTIAYTPENATFTNTYVAEGSIVLSAGKKLVAAEGLNAPDVTGKYTLTLEAVDGAPMPEGAKDGKVEITNIDGDGTMDSFGIIAYTEADAGKTYTYKVTEAGTVAGVENGTAEYTVKVTVTDNGDGTLTAEVTEGSAETLFTNTYKVKPTTTSFPVEKILTVPEGVDGPTDWSYDITVAAGEGAPEAEAMTGKVTKAASTATFGPFTYTEPGIYTYTVSESGDIKGVTNDSEAAGKTVTVTVVDNGDGTMTATADSTTDKPLNFTNVYAAEGTAVPVAKKVAKGFELTADQFSFELKDADGKVLQTKKNDADGNVTFDPIPYTATGTYKYTINEVVVENDKIADDTHVCDVTVTVTDKGDGTLEAKVEYSNNTFTNTHNENEKEVYAGTTETKVDGELVGAGDILTYTISYANNTEGVATVTVEDTIPDNTTYVDGSADPEATFDGSKLTWTIEGVEPGATGSVTFQVQVDDDAKDVTIENTGKVNDGENDSSTNAVTTSVPVKDVKDESGATIDGKGVQVGDTLTYEVGFTLTEDATSVVVTDDVPANTTLVDGSITEGGTLSGNTITWDLGALEAGDYTVSFQVTVDESAVTVDAITNTANISVNNHSEVKTNTVTNTPEIGGLTVSKTVEVPEGFKIDEDAAFTFTVKLTDKNDKALEGEYKYTGAAEGTITNGDTVTLKHGESITIAGLPAGAKYEISEATVDGYTPAENPIKGAISADATASATAKFVNAYKTDPAKIELGASKTLAVEEPAKNPPDVSGKYTFTIAAASEGAPLPATTEVTNPDGDGTPVSFGDISFTKPGDYQYTITESGEVAGVTNGQTSYTVKVKVSDNGDGTLSAEVIEGKQTTAFTNTYKVTPVTIDKGFEVTKDLTGTPLKAGAFEFVLTGAEGAPMPAKTEATNDDQGKVTFDTITYTKPGTYTYTITEKDGGKGGYSYDTNTVTVTVTVTDNGEGKLVAEVAYSDDVIFDNTYEANGDVNLSAAKELTGRALEEGQFTFQLKDADGNVIETVTNNGSGAVQFKTISYDQSIFDDQAASSDDSAADDTTAGENADEKTEDPSGAVTDEAAAEAGDETATDEAAADETTDATAEDAAEAAAEETTEATAEETTDENADEPRTKTFNYTIVEVNDGKAGYTYDEHEIAVEVKVVDNDDGTLTATPVYTGETTFTNAYEAEGDAQFNGIKTATGKELTEGQFTFQLKDAQGNVIEEVTNDANGNFAFAPIAYKQNAEQKDADTGKFEYTIVEVNDGQTGWTYDAHESKVTVTVTDNGDGTLATEVAYGDGDQATFVNPYKPLSTSAPIKAKKVLEGRDLKAGEFTFNLMDSNGKVVATVTNSANGTVDFGTFTFDEVGTFTYTASEVEGKDSKITYDTSVKTYTVEVEDVDGQLVATVTCDDESATFTNTYKPDEPKKKIPPVIRRLVPRTGDPAAAGNIITLSAMGTASLLTGIRMRRKNKKH